MKRPRSFRGGRRSVRPDAAIKVQAADAARRDEGNPDLVTRHLMRLGALPYTEVLWVKTDKGGMRPRPGAQRNMRGWSYRAATNTLLDLEQRGLLTSSQREVAEWCQSVRASACLGGPRVSGQAFERTTGGGAAPEGEREAHAMLAWGMIVGALPDHLAGSFLRVVVHNERPRNPSELKALQLALEHLEHARPVILRKAAKSATKKAS